MPRILTAFLLFLATAAGSNAFAQQATPDTLRFGLSEAIARSLRQSPEVGRRRAQLDYAQARHYQAKASRYLPEFSLKTVHSVAPGLDRSVVPDSIPDDGLYLDPSVENDWSLGALRPFNAGTIEFGQPVWTWGELSGSIEAARRNEDVKSASIEEKELEVAFRTARLYYDLLLAQQLARLSGEAREKLDRAEREVQDLLRKGDSTVSDADLFQVQISRQKFQRRVVELRQRRLTAVSGFGRQLFAPPGATVLPDTTILDSLSFQVRPLEEYVEIALRNRPELKQARAGMAAREALVEVEKSEYYPKLFLGGRFGERYAAGRPNQESAYIGENFVGSTTEAAFSIEQNLNFFQTRAKVEQAEAELNEVRFQQEAARQLVPFEVEKAYRDLLSARGALRAQDRAYDLSKEWERLEQTNADLGFGSTDDLISATQARLKLQVSYYQAVRDYDVAAMRLLRAVGVLNEPQKAGTLVDFL